jgi:molybdenum cofactor cytidylyltransferase
MKSIPGILLSSGRSTRFGSEKLLAYLPSGEMLLERALRIHLQSRILPLIAVVSPSLGTIIKEQSGIFSYSRLTIGKCCDTWHVFSCKWGSGRLIINEDFYKGISSSIKRGIQCLTDEEKAGGLVVTLADLPLLSSETINFFINSFLDEKADFLVPVFNDITGHPVIFDFNRFRNDIDQLRGDVGLRALIKKSSNIVQTIPWKDDSVIYDIDTPGDLKRLEGALHPSPDFLRER